MARRALEPVRLRFSMLNSYRQGTGWGLMRMREGLLCAESIRVFANFGKEYATIEGRW